MRHVWIHSSSIVWMPQPLGVKVTLLDIKLKKLQLLIPWDLRDYNDQRSKYFFFGSFFIMKFFTSKFVKIRCCLGLFTTFGRDFQMKLTMYGSSLSLGCVSMSELEFFWWIEIFVQNFNNMELMNFLEKK
jgi:hypothetical protein